jgi:NAD(P)-dependent dehydrogenase (short-subunit alcohol dehydrogenase family)
VANVVKDRGLAGLVNNAGIAVAGPMEFVPIDALRHQFDVNVMGLVETTQAFMPLIREGKGRIVHVGSIAGKTTVPTLGPYSASKHAVEAVTDAMRQELRSWGVEVSLVEPGAIATPIWEKSKASNAELAGEFPPEAFELYGPMIEAVHNLASDAAKRAIPAERVAEVIAHALTAARPKTRYLVGTDAKIHRVLRMLMPGRLGDRVFAKLIKLPK